MCSIWFCPLPKSLSQLRERDFEGSVLAPLLPIVGEGVGG